MSGQLKVILGAGGTRQYGWHSLNQVDLDVRDPASWSRLFAPNSVDVLLAEHVWEHLKPSEAVQATRLCFDYLKPGGYFRIAVPDGLHPHPKYIDWVRPGGVWNPHDHHFLYTYKTLGKLLSDAGFNVQLYEWWDEHQLFRLAPHRFEHGYIRRSQQDWYARWFLTFVVGAPYTSLVVDARKPKAVAEVGGSRYPTFPYGRVA